MIENVQSMDRLSCLAHVKRVLVKVGSAVLTRDSVLQPTVVRDLVAQLASLHDRGIDVVLVSSGAVAAGRGVVCNHASCPDLQGVPDKQAAAAIGQSRLMQLYDQAFSERGKVSAQILLTRDDLQSRRRFLNARNTFGVLLAWRAIPVVNENDTVVVRELEYGDNDHLASLLINLVEADLYVNLTSAAGVYTQNPDQHPDATPVPYIDNIGKLNIDALCGGKTSVGSGGMYSKLLAARRAAKLGIPTLVLSGRDPDAITRALSGEALGTWIEAETKTMSSRKFWLAYNRDAKGVLVVDPGAKTALKDRGKSLLAAGVVAVEGNFSRGALVRVEDEMGERLGVGLVNYRAIDLRKVRGLKTSQIEAILGEGMYREVIHRNNMVLEP